jgi:predicted transposase YdaD
MKTDALLYRLFQEHPSLVFELAGWPPPKAPYELRAEEIKQTHFRLDGVLIPAVADPDAPLVFLENQFQPDADFYARWFASIFLYLRLHPGQRDWRAVVLFPSRAQDAGNPQGYEALVILPASYPGLSGRTPGVAASFSGDSPDSAIAG